jgi:hypothetical protein
LLRRPFFGISYDIGRHSTFTITFEAWHDLYVRSQEAIFWVDKNDSVLENWFPAMYSLIVCALIQVSGLGYVLLKYANTSRPSTIRIFGAAIRKA